MRNGERIDSIEIIIYNACILWWKHNSYELTFFTHACKQVGGGGARAANAPPSPPPPAGQIISKSPEFTPLILATKSKFS